MHNFNIDIGSAMNILSNTIPFLNKNIKINNDLIQKNIQKKLLLQLKKINFYYSKLI